MVLLDVIGSKSKLKTDKKTYQMDFRNSFEVFRVGFDINEGKDMIMVKPGMFYLDLISKLKILIYQFWHIRFLGNTVLLKMVFKKY